MAKKVVPNHGLAARPAQRAIELRLQTARHSRGERASPRRSRVRPACTHLRRAPRPWATVMRHFLAQSLPVRPLTTGVKTPPTRCLLVPATGFPQASAARPLPTRIAAVPMAAIAPRAQVHRPPTLVAYETAAIGAASLHSRLLRPGLRHPSSGILDSLGLNPQASRRGAFCLRKRRPRRTSPFFQQHNQPVAPQRATMMLIRSITFRG